MNDAPIPPDIRKAAEAVVERGYNEGLVDAVCRALMVERERCAMIVEDSVFKIGGIYAQNIAGHIRRRGSS